MLGFILRRILISIPVLFVASFVVYIGVATSVDPLAQLRNQPRVSKQTVELRERQLGLDRPLLVRYGEWAKDAVIEQDLGQTVGAASVSTELKRATGVTMRLVLLSLVIAVVLAVTIGVVSAIKQYSFLDYAGTYFAFVFFSMPVFWLAGILKDLGIRFNQRVGHTVLYTVGESSAGVTGGFWELLPNRLGHLVLPTMTLTLVSMAAWSRFQRGSMLEILNSDFIRTARAKGLSERKVLTRHALRNALAPLVTVVAIDGAALLTGAILTETVFAWKGLGRVLLQGIHTGDVNLVAGWILITSIFVIFGNLIADILYAVLDPRVRT